MGRGRKFVLVFEDDVTDDEIMVIIPYKAIYDPSSLGKAKNRNFTTPHLWVGKKRALYGIIGQS